MFYLRDTIVSVKDRLFREMKIFLFKNLIYDPKMQNNHNYVFW